MTRFGNIVPGSQHSIGYGKRIPVDCDIVYAENSRALNAQQRARRCRCRIALRRLPAGDGAEEPFARRAGEKRQAEAVQLFETRHQLQIFARRLLGKPKAWIEHDPVAQHAGGRSNLERALEKEDLVFDDIGKFLPVATGMHDAEPCPGFSRQGRDFGLSLQAEDIVDDMGAGTDGSPRRFRAIGIDGNQGLRASFERFDNGQYPRLFLRRADGGRVRPRRLTTDIENVSAVCNCLKRICDSPVDRVVAPPSEKESGVTLMIAMITERLPSSISRPWATRQKLLSSCFTSLIPSLKRVCDHPDPLATL